MDDREFIIQLWRGLSFIANDPSTTQGTARGARLMIDAIERKYELRKPYKKSTQKPTSIEKSDTKTRQPETSVL